MAWDAGGYQPYSLADDLTFRARDKKRKSGPYLSRDAEIAAHRNQIHIAHSKAAAVERLSLWWRRENQSLGKNLGSSRRVFCSRYLASLVRFYRRGSWRSAWQKWRDVVEHSRRFFEVLTNLRSKLMRHNSLNTWKRMSRHAAMACKRLDSVVNRAFRNHYMRWWIDRNRQFTMMQRMVVAMFNFACGDCFAAWRLHTIRHNVASSFSLLLGRTIDSATQRQGWKRWLTAHRWTSRVYKERCAILNREVQKLGKRVSAVRFRRWHEAVGLGDWGERIFDKRAAGNLGRQAPQIFAVRRPRAPRRKLEFQMRRQKSVKDRANAKQVSSQRESLSKFVHALRRTCSVRIQSMMIERPSQSSENLSRELQIKAEETELQALASNCIVEPVTSSESELLIMIRCFMPAGTKFVMVVLGATRLHALLARVFSDIERVEDIRAPGLVCPNAVHIILSQEALNSSTAITPTHQHSHFNVWHFETVVHVLAALATATGDQSGGSGAIPESLSHWVSQPESSHLAFMGQSLPVGLPAWKADAEASTFRLQSHGRLAESMFLNAFTGSRPLVIVELSCEADNPAALGQICVILDTLKYFLSQGVEGRRRPSSVDVSAHIERLIREQEGVQASYVHEHVEQMCREQEEALRDTGDEVAEAHRIDSIGLVYSLDDQAQCFKRHMYDWVESRQAILKWLEQLVEEPTANLMTAERLVAGARPVIQPQEHSFALGCQIATRLKPLFPDHVVFLTNFPAQSLLSKALDLHESLGLIPVNVIAMDVPREKTAHLEAVAARTGGTFASQDTRTFMK